ncbi:MAG TPA: hypothetical protein VE777_18265 [Gaiellales bacterium]|jgi:hypothetical protein|nr:hypothetical protein [Gaiellales bacterium]
MSPANVLDQSQDLAAQVEAWRLHVLLRAGYPLRVAERLAKSSADLHQAVAMLERGCTPHVAARILT